MRSPGKRIEVGIHKCVEGIHIIPPYNIFAVHGRSENNNIIWVNDIFLKSEYTRSREKYIVRIVINIAHRK